MGSARQVHGAWQVYPVARCGPAEAGLQRCHLVGPSDATPPPGGVRGRGAESPSTTLTAGRYSTVSNDALRIRNP